MSPEGREPARHALRQLVLADMAEAAALHRAAFDHALPWLAGRHTPEEDRAFFREHVFVNTAVWGSFSDGRLTGLATVGANPLLDREKTDADGSLLYLSRRGKTHDVWA